MFKVLRLLLPPMILIPRMKPFPRAACLSCRVRGESFPARTGNAFHTFTYFNPLSVPVPLLLLWLALPSRCFGAGGVVRASPHEDPIPDTHPPLENIQSQGRASLRASATASIFARFQNELQTQK